jgi:hypothetical protein
MALTKVIGSGIGSFELTEDTASGNNASIGFTATEGLILTGQGSTNDVTIKNDADADVIEIPTGTTNVTVAGALKPATYQETYSGLSAAATIACDLCAYTDRLLVGAAICRGGSSAASF